MYFHHWQHFHHLCQLTGEGNGTPLQYSCLENPMNGGAWWATVHGVAKSQTQLSDFTFTFHFHALEKEMATHSSVLAWRIPGMWEPGGLPSMGSHRVGHDWSGLAAAVAFMRSIAFCFFRTNLYVEVYFIPCFLSLACFQNFYKYYKMRICHFYTTFSYSIWSSTLSILGTTCRSE